MKPDDIALWAMIADWFAAIGTVGALLLALALLHREIMRGRRAPVDALVVWIDTVSRPRDGDASYRWVYRITAYNSSEAPLPAVSVRLATKSGSVMRTVRVPPVAGPAEFAGKAKEQAVVDTDWDLFTFGVPTALCTRLERGGLAEEPLHWPREAPKHQVGFPARSAHMTVRYRSTAWKHQVA